MPTLSETSSSSNASSSDEEQIEQQINRSIYASGENTSCATNTIMANEAMSTHIIPQHEESPQAMEETR